MIHTSKTAHPGEPVLVQPGKGHPVLVADDHEDARETLTLMLEALGFEVMQAQDGREALTMLGRGPLPRMILLDMMMPVMNGWEVLYQLQDDPKLARIPVVVLSGVADLERMEEEEGSPVVFLQKPVDPTTLLHVLEHYCAGAPA
ncbi:MAG: response regulator [Armatimonadetes bacterium]|nr:response regulator [Armatimonadota bacterium]